MKRKHTKYEIDKFALYLRGYIEIHLFKLNDFLVTEMIGLFTRHKIKSYQVTMRFSCCDVIEYAFSLLEYLTMYSPQFISSFPY